MDAAIRGDNRVIKYRSGILMSVNKNRGRLMPSIVEKMYGVSNPNAPPVMDIVIDGVFSLTIKAVMIPTVTPTTINIMMPSSISEGVKMFKYGYSILGIKRDKA